MTAIELVDVSVEFEGVQALAEVHLAVEPGEFVTVIGPSGSGKTTLLRTIGGLQEPTRGAVSIDGEDPESAQSEGRIGYVFQDHTLFPWQTAIENVRFLREMAGKSPKPGRARSILSEMGLDGFEDHYPEALSGGMKQRVAIGRALHLGADLLLMDEPFGELDELTREEIGVEIRRLWRDHDRTIVFVTHSVPEAVLLGDRCLVVDGPPGRIVRQFDVDLPRPREESVLESAAFQSTVSDIRAELHRKA